MLDFLAQASVDPVTSKAVVEAADFLSQKDLRWWFAGLFVLLLSGGMMAIWWLLKYHNVHVQSLTTQLSEQRAANNLLNDKLIQYISGDHVVTLQTIREVSEIMKQISAMLARMEHAK